MINDNEIDAVITTWHDILENIPNEVAYTATRELCRVRPKFAPDPAEIYLACTVQEKSFYELQRQEEETEQLALEEYFEKAVPMPDHIRERLERSNKKRKVNSDES